MKYMKYSKALLWTIIILPWFSVPLLGKETFKRFLPAGLFISIIVHIVNFIGKKREWWWWWYAANSQKVTWVVPFTWGPFFIGSNEKSSINVCLYC